MDAGRPARRLAPERWKEAEEIAAISDKLLLSPEVELRAEGLSR